MRLWLWQKRCGAGDVKGFQVDLGEIQELTDVIPEELTEVDLMKMSASKPVPGDEEEDMEEAVPN